jgi:hypothetical protein
LRTALIPKPSPELTVRGLRASPDRSGHERTGFDTVLVAKVVASPKTCRSLRHEVDSPGVAGSRDPSPLVRDHRPFGAGGMGEVCRARDTRLKRDIE